MITIIFICCLLAMSVENESIKETWIYAIAQEIWYSVLVFELAIYVIIISFL